MKAVFFTMHIAGAPRKANLLLLADGFATLGWDVRIVTLSYSWLTILKGDSRHSYARRLPRDRWFEAAPNLKGYLRRTLLSPSRLPMPWLNRLFKPFFRWHAGRLPGKVTTQLHDADLVIIESGPGPLLVPFLKQAAPNAKFVYFCSDRLTTLRVNPVILDAERRYIRDFDLISVPSSQMLSDFDHPNCVFIPQGVAKDAFDAVSENPYVTERNIVSVGDMLFDEQAVATLARDNPDWTIHLFGGSARCKKDFPNVVSHGETPFEKIVPYIKYADIGLAPYLPAPNVEYIAQSSLKIAQYTYAKLPILAPNFAATFYKNIVAYDPKDLSSLRGAFDKAVSVDRTHIQSDPILSWAEIAQKTVDIYAAKMSLSA